MYFTIYTFIFILCLIRKCWNKPKLLDQWIDVSHTRCCCWGNNFIKFIKIKVIKIKSGIFINAWQLGIYICTTIGSDLKYPGIHTSPAVYIWVKTPNLGKYLGFIFHLKSSVAVSWTLKIGAGVQIIIHELFRNVTSDS